MATNDVERLHGFLFFLLRGGGLHKAKCTSQFAGCYINAFSLLLILCNFIRTHSNCIQNNHMHVKLFSSRTPPYTMHNAHLRTAHTTHVKMHYTSIALMHCTLFIIPNAYYNTQKTHTYCDTNIHMQQRNTHTQHKGESMQIEVVAFST